MAETGTDIQKASRLLIANELVAIPTETVYGLAANALNPEAVIKIFEAKKRPFFDPLIVHISNMGQLEKYAKDIPSIAYRLAERFWPGPLTLLLPKQDIIPDIVTSGLDTVGIRCPAHPLTHQLLSITGFPLAAPSANPFGYVSPTTAAHVDDQLGNVISYILDGGPCKVGVESTILGFENDSPIIYRLGGLSIEDIEAVAGKVSVSLNTSSNPQAPGQLKSHYAPGKPLYIGDIDNLLRHHKNEKAGIISFSKSYYSENIVQQWILSPQGSLHDAAQKLFSALREADHSDIDILLAERFPEEELGRAINDRLQRASVKAG
jgi:L-threonylcarbamoyladenylate synthase